jgi:hypothetical protein
MRTSHIESADITNEAGGTGLFHALALAQSLAVPVLHPNADNQAGRYISSNRWNMEVFWQCGQVKFSPPSTNSGLRGHSGSNGSV